MPGHWEGGLIGGSRNSYVATLVERRSRYGMLTKVANKDPESIVSTLIKQFRKMPSELYQFLTWDRGRKLADHKRPAPLATSRSTPAIRGHCGSNSLSSPKCGHPLDGHVPASALQHLTSRGSAGRLIGSIRFISRLIRKPAPECAIEPAILPRALLKDLLGSVRTRHPTTARIARGSQIRDRLPAIGPLSR